MKVQSISSRIAAPFGIQAVTFKPSRSTLDAVISPTTDHRPFAELDLHRIVMADLIQVLGDWLAADSMVYITGNFLVFHVAGDRDQFISPDVLVVRGVPKHQRDNCLIWQEGKAPAFVFEVTSATTSNEDRNYEFDICETKLKVKELFFSNREPNTSIHRFKEID